MQKLKPPFFDRHVVRQEGSDLHPGIQKLNVSCACGGPEHLWIGDQNGQLRRLDKQFYLSPSVQVFDQELLDVTVAQEGRRLIALGIDAASPGGAQYKIFDTERDGDPVLLAGHRLFPPRGPQHRATCITANSTLTLLAIGLDTGSILLFRGRDLSKDNKPWSKVLGDEGERPVTAVHFLEQSARTVLFDCNLASVRSWSVLNRDELDLRNLHSDAMGGADKRCSCTFPMLNALLVAKGDAVFAYDPDEGNMSAITLDGEKMILTHFKSYFITVMAESGQSIPGGGASPSSMPKHQVMIVSPKMRFIVYSEVYADVTHVVKGMGSVFVFSRGGADGNTVLFELREKAMSEQLEILVKKRMFDWAAEVALHGGAPPESTAEIYRLHGDALFEKRAYDQALAIYMKTINLGLPLEPSYVVERYLDAQRIGHVAKYLKRLHEKNLAGREHTALLLKCYTKLKDFSTLGEFLEETPVSQYDPVTAIEVLEAAGYYGLAAEIAQKVDRHEDYVRISLEHFKFYQKTTQFLQTLPKARAAAILLEHGRLLMSHAPRDTIELVRDICGLQAGATGAPGELPELVREEGVPHVDEMLPIFVDDLNQLELFLRSVLLAPGGCPLPQAEAERLYPTLLELMVRSHRALLDSKEPSPDDEQRSRRLHSEIMRLVRQHPSEGALASTLMLCQTYGFVDGFFHAAERLGRFQLLMNWCFEQRDAKRLLEVCKRCGSVDQSLWVQALSFLAADEGEHMEEISEVLRHVEESDLMPMLMVIQTLQRNSSITVGDVRPYLQSQFRRLVESVATSRKDACQDRQEIVRMQQEIASLRTRAQTFQSTKCAQCGSTLEVPAVHFFCGHSFHAYCVPQDGGCPKCSSEALPKITLKEQRESQARNTEDFFKELQCGGGEGGIQAMGEWCKFGAFDVSSAGAHDEQDP